MELLSKWLDPPWLVRLSPSELEELRRRANLGLAQRQLAVGGAYLLFYTAFAVLTDFALEHPAKALAMGACLLVLAIWRWMVSRRIVDRDGFSCAKEHRQFRIGCILTAVVWSYFTVDGLMIYGQTWIGFILVVAVTGLVNVAASSLALDLRLSFTYLAILTAAPIAWALTPGPGTWLIITMAVLYFCFVSNLSRRQNFASFAALRDNLRLEVQARELRKAKEMAESATIAKTQFLAAMSHEIRTPLSGVLGLVHLLAETRLDPSQRDLTRSIQHSGEMLLTIVNDILDYSKIGAGKLTLERISFDLRALIADVIEPMRAVAINKGLALDCHISSALPEWLQGDPTRLKQVLNNLLSNALKFTHTGSVRVIVHWDKNVDEGAPRMVRFAVRDTGIGIPAESLGHLFDEFSQADQSTTRRFGGTGLGLAICRKLVDAMSGEIGVESSPIAGPGQGSLFWFHLPLEKGSPITRKSVISQQELLPRLRVLIAEDNPVNQRIIVHTVQKMGHAVTLAHNGVEAVERFSEAEFDLILMDCQMPLMDGFEAARAIRRSGPKGRRIPIVAVTANAFAEDASMPGCPITSANRCSPGPLRRRWNGA